MMKEAVPDLYVMDTLANDIENLESVLRMLNSDTVLGWHAEWGRRFNRMEIIQALSRLVRRDLVQVLAYSEAGKGLEPLPPTVLPPYDYDDVYFSLTSRGRMVHANWARADEAID